MATSYFYPFHPILTETTTSLADLEAEIERRELVWSYLEALARLIDTPQFKRWNEHGPSLLALTRLTETQKAQAALRVLGEK